MSWICDSTELISGSWLTSVYPGHGILGSAVSNTGDNGGSPVYNDLSLPADANKEYRWAVTVPPGSGTLAVFEDLTFEFDPPSNGVYTFTYQLWEDGVSQGTAVVTMTSGTAITISDVGGIPSAEAFGTPVASNMWKITSVGGIPSSEAFGLPDIAFPITISNVGAIPSQEAFGVPTLTTAISLTISNVGAIPSQEAFGVPTVSVSLHADLYATSIPSAEAFGLPVLRPAGQDLSFGNFEMVSLQPREWNVNGQVGTLEQLRNLNPTFGPIDPIEIRTAKIDFRSELGATETLTSATLNLTRLAGPEDLDPNSRLLGDYQIKDGFVYQQLFDCQEGTLYHLRCAAFTSLGNYMVVTGTFKANSL